MIMAAGVVTEERAHRMGSNTSIHMVTLFLMGRVVSMRGQYK
jgi:hypothetical protein